MPNRKEWFGEWFDSPYYHILYENRDEGEAKVFIDNLVNHFQPQNEDKILDLACGKGRHSIYLNEKGYQVVGIDLSGQNIAHARQFENERLHFHRHDMREEFRHEEFDYVFNMFTSFGYFDTTEENQKAISAVSKALKKGGTFLLDFLNTYRVVHHLQPCEIKKAGSIQFEITRDLSPDGFILKNIEFSDNGDHYKFQEKVKAIRRVEFLEYFEKAGLKLKDLFGDYHLNPYEKETSDRLIFVAEKM